MSSQRSRARQGGTRGGTHENGEEMHMWQELKPLLAKIQVAEVRAKELVQEIIETEGRMKAKENAGTMPTLEELNELDTLYREQVRIAESQKTLLAERFGDLKEKLTVLIGIQRHNEEASEAPPMRGSNSRSSALDFDGPSDSPVPSPAENRQVRKIGTGRTSSQPPRSTTDGTSTPAEVAERSTGKPKVVFSLGEEVAFKRKVPGKTEEQDWIQGIVTRVIGEGKSRRYDVQDPYPDDANVRPDQQFTYKSSASQMVPIPPLGTHLEDYEVGKRVLALYPDTTTFYRAEVKAMLEDGAKVQLLFEDEAAGALKAVERRFVLDHKG